MLNVTALTRKLDFLINEAANQVAHDVIAKQHHTKGREEVITAHLDYALSKQLINAIHEKLEGAYIDGINFRVYTCSKMQESRNGADVCGMITTNFGGVEVSKAYLAQAKVAKTSKLFNNGRLGLTAGDRKLFGQMDKMAHITSSAFVFVYSQFGVHVVPANQLLTTGSERVDTRRHSYITIGKFYSRLFRCYSGDSALARRYDDIESGVSAGEKPKENVAEIVAERTGASNVIVMEASI